MLNSRLHRFVVTLLLWAPFAATASPTECSNGNLQRSVEVVYSNPGHPVPCEVLYNTQNEGTYESLWKANNEAGYCEDRAREFIGKLEQMGWSCAAVTAPAPAAPEELIGEES